MFVCIKSAVFVAALSGIAVAHASAKESCDQSFFPAYENSDRSGNFLLLSPETCTVKRVTTPNFECEINVGYQHGSTHFSCGSALYGQWRSRAKSDARSYFDTLGSGPRSKVPSASQGKRNLAEMRSTSGASPISEEDYPLKFTDIGGKLNVFNPEFETYIQIIKYINIKNEPRIAITGELSAACEKIQFVYFTAQDQLEEKHRDMGSFLGDIRLEAVTNTKAALANRRTSGVKKYLEKCPHDDGSAPE